MGAGPIGWWVAVVTGAAVACAGTGTVANAPPAPAPVTAVPGTGPAGDDHEPATTRPRRPLPAAAFAAADEELRNRVTGAGLPGGALLVVRDGEVVHELAVGRVTRSTPLQTASAAKWLTAATVMTFVDAGTVRLDDPVATWLPELDGAGPAVTLRQLLTHTSGVRDDPCLWAGSPLADCVRRVVAAPREFAPGTAFSYGNAGYHVLGRVVEALGGADFATVFRERIGGPLAMDATAWPGAPAAPSPAAGLTTTVDDYARFLAMILGRGELEGRRVLSAPSAAALVADQVGAFDTTADHAVGITGIPRYAFGAWPDVVAAGTTEVVSGNGGRGFYPWVDFTTGSYGVVGVQDDRGAERAVPASQRVAVAARDVLRRA